MELFQALVLGIVQGLTEFFPISSSGHLIIIPQIFHWNGIVDSLSFDVALHLGTVAALIIFFWKDWVRLISSFLSKLLTDRKNIFKDTNSRLFILLIIGSIPAGLIGFSLQHFIENNTRSLLLVGITLIVFGIFLWYFDKKGKQNRDLEKVSIKDALLIGIAQAVSLIPGVSRSGVTITAARVLNIDRESAVRYSFLLSTPAILGAGLVSAKGIVREGLGNPTVFLIGFIASAVSGFLAIKLLLYLAKRENFNIFVIYRIVLGFFLIFYSLFFV